MPLSRLLLFLLTISVITSCSKYEENSGLNLSSKKSRLLNNWVTYEYVDYNGEVRPDAALFRFEFKSDGSGEFQKSTSSESMSGSNTGPFEWEFSDDKTQLFLSEGYSAIFEIIKLEKDDLILGWIGRSEIINESPTQKFKLMPLE